MFISVGNLAALKGVIGRQDGKRRLYTKELKREMGTLEIMQCSGKILETRLDFVLTLILLFWFFFNGA